MRPKHLLLGFGLLLRSAAVQAQCPDLGATKKTVASSFHSTVIIDYTGAVRYWGDGASHTTINTDVLSPATLPSSSYTGTPKAVAASSVSYEQQHQHFLLTTAGLYGWGYSNRTINTSTVGNVVLTDMTSSLPVAASTISFIESAGGGIAIVTTTGEVYVRQGGSGSANSALIYGDGSTGTTMNTSWHKVKTNSTTDLTGVTRISYACRGLMALTGSGKLYVWGDKVMLGDGTANADRAYATEMTLPASVTVSDMAIVTKFTYNANASHAAQFIIGTNGKLYAVGENYRGVLGQGDETDQVNWVTVKGTAGGATELTNLVQLSTNNSYPLQLSSGEGYYAVGALNSSGQLYLWGHNSYSMLGGSTSFYSLPRIPPNFSVNEAQVGFFEMGGHTTIAFLAGSNKFCYVGHKVRGSMGDGIGGDEQRNSYDCVNTPPEYICEPPAPLGCPTPSANDLVASANHSTVVMNGQPSVTYWGEGSSSAEAGVNVNTPRVLYEYNGTPKGVAASGVSEATAANGTQMWILTNKGIWGWGYSANTITSGTPGAVGLTIMQLPVAIGNVSFIRSSRGGLALVTTTGEVYVRAGAASACSGRVYGDGTITLDASGATAWHQVTTAPSTPLTGVRELSFGGTAAMAIANSGVYVWGDSVFTGSGAASPISRATLMTLHADFGPTMIAKSAEIILSGGNESAQFLLGSNGKVYSLGRNLNGVLGRGISDGTTISTSWQPTALSSIRKLSSNNPFSNGTYSMGALSLDGTIFLWGSSSSGMLGTATANNPTPFTPSGIATGSVAGFEIGGHQTIIFPKSGSQFYFSGHCMNGAKGDNTGNSTINAFTLGATVSNCAGVVYDISGHFYQDANGMVNNLVDGSGINTLGSTTMYANLLDENGYVVGTTTINSGTGAYTFTGYPSGNYTIQISSTAGTLFATAPASSGIPSSWVFTGEQIGTTAGAGIEAGTADGRLAIALSATTTNANIGVEQLPVASVNNMTNQPYNPLGTLLPGISFVHSDADGTVTHIRISGFPTNASSITIGGTVYTASGGGGTTAFPGGGLTLSLTGGVPSSSIFIVPTSAGVTVGIPFYARDNAGYESNSAGSVNIPFVNSGITVSGTVWADGNANGVKEVTESVTNAARAGETLYALLIQTNNTPAGVPQVVSSSAVNASGLYSFANVANGNDFLLRIVSMPSAPSLGTLASTINPRLADNHLGVSVNDGGSAPAATTTATQQITITGLAASALGRDFGIQQLPKTTSDSYTISTPPGHAVRSLTVGNGMGPLRGSDAEDMPVTNSLSGKNVTIVSVAGMDGNLLQYDGVTVTDNTNIPSYDPAKLAIRFEGTGSTSAVFTFNYTDAGSAVSPSAGTYTVSWGSALPLSLLAFDARKQVNTVLLSWTTANEMDMSAFTVMRSGNGLNWQELGTLAPKGSGNYLYTDQRPLSGLSYYRLRMEEQSGTYTFSPTRSISSESTNAPVLTLYPNPVNDQLSLRADGEVVSIEITDVNGRKVYQSSGSIPASIDTRNWPDGTYFIRAELADHSTVQYRIGKVSK